MGGSIQNVAVIGAGVSGVVSALHLEDAGLKVTVYERSSAAGGVWFVYTHQHYLPIFVDRLRMSS